MACRGFQLTPARDIQLAKKVLESCDHHAGLVQGRNGLGIRASKANIVDIKNQQGQDATPCYCVRGLPPAMSLQELEELLKHLGWAARPESDGRRMNRGGASWRVRAENPPPISFRLLLTMGILGAMFRSRSWVRSPKLRNRRCMAPLSRRQKVGRRPWLPKSPGRPH